MRPGPVFSLLAATMLLATACGGGAGTDLATEGAAPSSTVSPSPDAAKTESEPQPEPQSETTPEPEPEPEPEREPQRDPKTVTVSIVDFAFEGGDLDLVAGDTVVFRHDGDVSHTVTNRAGEFDSGNLRPGDTYSVTLTNPGEFTYVCLYHSQMSGTITVSG